MSEPRKPADGGLPGGAGRRDLLETLLGSTAAKPAPAPAPIFTMINLAAGATLHLVIHAAAAGDGGRDNAT